MAKTDLIKPYLGRIEALGDQLWYFLFVSEELNQGLAKYSPKAKEHYTVDLFATNPYSRRIHVKANNLITHQDNNKKFTFGSYFSTSYEIAGNYIKDTFAKLKSFNSLPNYTWVNNDPPEINLKTLLTYNGIALPDQEIFDTFSYLRIRRNHFTHLLDVANPRLVTFCGVTGPSLNTYWRTPGYVTYIDFTTTVNINEYTQDITIELMKILRITLINLDKYIASILDVNSVIQSLVTREFGTENIAMNSIIAKQRSSKIIYLASQELKLSVTEAQCDPHVRSIGVK